MPEQRINLNDILREERKLRRTKTHGSNLVQLESDFYIKAALYIRSLEDEKRTIEDTYSTKYAILEDEVKTARKALEDLINLRTAKIIKEASLHASSKQRDKQELGSMTQEERNFYDRLLNLMTEWRSELLEKIFKKEKQASPPENKRTETAPEDKKDISKEYIVVRLLKDIPTFVGADGRNYTLTKEDVVTLSAMNARALINRKAAVQVAIER